MRVTRHFPDKNKLADSKSNSVLRIASARGDSREHSLGGGLLFLPLPESLAVIRGHLLHSDRPLSDENLCARTRLPVALAPDASARVSTDLLPLLYSRPQSLLRRRPVRHPLLDLLLISDDQVLLQCTTEVRSVKLLRGQN